jgi:hypothetical protein
VSKAYSPKSPDLKSSPALPHFTACLEAVINEATVKNDCDEEAVRDWLGRNGRHFDDTLSRLDHAYSCHRRTPSAEAHTNAGKNLWPDLVREHEENQGKGGGVVNEGGLPVRSSGQQDQWTQHAATQAASAKSSTGDDVPSNPSRVVTWADIERAVKRHMAERKWTYQAPGFWAGRQSLVSSVHMTLM